MAVAAEVIARKGIAAATMRDIADAAGMLSGSLYHHFASKDEMVCELLEGALRERIERDRVAIAQGGDPVEVMARLIAIGVAGVAEDPDVSTIVHRESTAFASMPGLAGVQALRTEGRLQWQAVIAEGMAQGVFDVVGDPDVVVRAMFDAVLSSARWMPPRGTQSPDQIARQLTRLFLSGLRTG